MRKLILFLLASVLFASCSIDEITTFNDDFSGKTITKIDMTAMIVLMSKMDTTGNGKTKFNKEIKKGMEDAKNKQPNLANIEMEFDTLTSSLNLSYTFKSIEDINNISSMMKENQKTMGSPKATAVIYQWKKKGKILVMPGVENLDQLKSSGQEAMLKGITYSLVRTFPKKIAKVSDPRITLSADQKTMTFKSTADEVINKPLTEITVTFK